MKYNIWSDRTKQLDDLITNNSLKSFIRWDIIKRTMFVSNEEYIKNELKYLKDLSDWKSRWSNTIIESPVGCPILYDLYPKSSENLIHHSYHLAKFEEISKIQIDDINFVFEFGGGYGSMCRLFRNLNYTKKYVIFDFPQLSMIQTFYLNALSLMDNTLCLSDIEILDTIIPLLVKPKSLFLATWSLSESPIETYNSIIPIMLNFDYFLISYQKHFHGTDIMKRFDELIKRIDNVLWYNFEIENIKDNYYLIGIKKGE